MLAYIQIILSVLLVIAILLQQRGSGLSSAFGGGSGLEYSTKRGAEKILFYATIVLAILFVATSLLAIR